MNTIQELIQQRILILDGAMGTMIQRHRLQEDDFRNAALQDHPHPLAGNNDLLTLTRPDIILDIHKSYLEAGADIIETNTFSSTSIAQADYGLEHLVYELNYEGARLAAEACREYSTSAKPRFVAGSIGPTNRTASISPDVDRPGFRAVRFDDLVEAYREQVRGLLDGGADILLVETVFDTLNAKAALFAIQQMAEERGIQVPVMVSGTITDASGRTLSGQTAQAFLISVSHVPLLSIGLNCALGAEPLTPYLDVLSEHAPFAVSAHPNAGLPNEMGGYDETPESMASQIETYMKRGLVNIIGGCCGTTPEHIKAIAEVAQHYSPRQLEPNANEPHV
ncbi:MAG: homocysteine S-methyltransferase family protein [Flavobacteriales bacterium]|nr:homocysteine S-methyltransferase family protein [Flavobacteriales bacterium]